MFSFVSCALDVILRSHYKDLLLLVGNVECLSHMLEVCSTLNTPPKKIFISMFSSKNLIVLAHTFWSIMHLVYFFIDSVLGLQSSFLK
jgi:hypothetical protein